MKLSKKVWLIVVIVIFAVALGVLFSIYSGQARELGQLEKALNATENRESDLEAQITDPAGLKNQLEEAEKELKEKKKQFPESVESIEYDDDLFEIADDCSVGLTKLTASKPTNKTVGTVTYSVSSFAVVVKGNIDDILDFIYAIWTGDDFQLPWSAEVTDVKINVSSGSATVNLVIYGYKR